MFLDCDWLIPVQKSAKICYLHSTKFCYHSAKFYYPMQCKILLSQRKNLLSHAVQKSVIPVKKSVITVQNSVIIVQKSAITVQNSGITVQHSVIIVQKSVITVQNSVIIVQKSIITMQNSGIRVFEQVHSIFYVVSLHVILDITKIYFTSLTCVKRCYPMFIFQQQNLAIISPSVSENILALISRSKDRTSFVLHSSGKLVLNRFKQASASANHSSSNKQRACL